MGDTDKIVAAILAAAHARKEAGIVNPADFVKAYEEMLRQMNISERGRADDLAGQLELDAERKDDSR